MPKLFLFDLSAYGWKEAVKEFFLSLFKTALAAAIAYLLVKLDNLHLATYIQPMYAGIGLMAIGGVRAVLTSLWKWATTLPTGPVPQGATVATLNATTLGDGSEMPLAQ